MRFQTLLLLLISTVIVVSGCNSGPEPIVQGRDECAHCKMLISDSRFAAQLVTDHGKYKKFDSIECLLDVLPAETNPRSIWVSNLAKPGQWIEAEQAVFIRSDKIKSPMGGGIAAFGTEAEAKSLTDGTPMTWRELTARL